MAKQTDQGKIIKSLEGLVAEIPSGKSFALKFLKAYGFAAATIKRLEQNDRSRNIALLPGDIGLAKQIFIRTVENANPGLVLKDLLSDSTLTSAKIRFFLVTDFKRLAAYDKRVDDSIEIDFTDLATNYDFFLPLTGNFEKPLAYSAHPADAKACEKMGKLYDIIRVLNADSDDAIHSLNIFLTRLLFCFFAEDTGIFPVKGQMTDALQSMTAADGSDIPTFFTRLFEVLDLPMTDPRRNLYPAVLQKFPYVNGGLFSEHSPVPRMNARARNLLIECGRLVWSDISPVIFGSMFQAVMDPELRHERGAHYTSEKNIFKVIRPLFLNALESELQSILEAKSNKKKRLLEFQEKLASIKCLDPACGCGNFLVIAYRELKTLELKSVEALLELGGQRDRSVLADWTEDYSRVSINQFYGIELEPFPVEVARVSMWLMEHVMNQKFGLLLGQVIPSIPLKHTAHIVCGNALTCDWESVVPASELTYIFGNPPFVGRPSRTPEQRQEVEKLTCGITGAKNFDYVCCWYFKASDILQRNEHIEVAFVSTNSITQGEQITPLWTELCNRGLHINFAHQTFKWSNDARGNAGVACVIIGFSRINKQPKMIFSERGAHQARCINGYLLPVDSLTFVHERRAPLQVCCTPMVLGNQPTDGGNLIIEANDLDLFANIEAIKPYIKKLVGSREFLHGEERYCLWLTKAPDSIKSIPVVADRIEKCRQMRLKSPKKATRLSAQTPHLFQDCRFSAPPDTAILIPRVSSERREYIPMAFVGPDTISTDANHMVPNGTLYDFGILESRMHMTWMRTVSGRLKSDYRYSRDLCYNTFAWPTVTPKQKEIIENLAGNILMVREYYPEMTLADLYDPDKMPDDLRKAHAELDAAVDKLYRKKPFADDEERLSHLFKRYEKLVSGQDDAVLFNEG